MLAFVVRQVLWVLGYPSFPTAESVAAPFAVGMIRTRIPGATACQILYPVDKADPPPKETAPYLRLEATRGMADYGRQSPDIIQFLADKAHPSRFQATPVAGNKFPIVVFSHGLGGCMEMYSQLCSQIAAQGYWVVSLEHEDGSGAYAEDGKTGEAIYYKRPDDTPYSREKVLNFRRPFLEQRVEEIVSVMEYVYNPNKPNSDDKTDDIVGQVFDAADATQGVHLLGHSFGGASMALVHQESSKRSTIPSIQSLSLLDCWAFSLEDKVLNNGCNDPDMQLLSIISEAWLTNPELEQLCQYLKASKQVKSWFVPRSRHASFSDAGSCWFPAWVSRTLSLRGAKEIPHQTVQATVRACVQQFSKKDIQGNEMLKKFSYASWQSVGEGE